MWSGKSYEKIWWYINDFNNEKIEIKSVRFILNKGPFKYYEVVGWGQKMVIFDDLHYCKSSKR